MLSPWRWLAVKTSGAMTEGKGLAKTLFCEQESLSSAMKKKELRLGVFFPLYLDAVNQCGSFAGGCNSGLRSWIHYAWVMSSDHCRLGWAWAGRQKFWRTEVEMSWWQEWVRPQLILLRSLAVMTGVNVWWSSPKRAAPLQTCCVKWWK